MKEKTNFFNLYFYIVTCSFIGTYIGFYKNFNPVDFLRLINNAECFVGNSSSAIREGS